MTNDGIDRRRQTHGMTNDGFISCRQAHIKMGNWDELGRCGQTYGTKNGGIIPSRHKKIGYTEKLKKDRKLG